MSDIFISYSRNDGKVANEIYAALVGKGRQVWIDLKNIPPSAEWWKSINEGIRLADNIAFLISPDSVSSPTCTLEIAYARSLHKRLLPVVVRPTDKEDAHKNLAIKNLTDFQRQLLGDRDLLKIATANWSEIAEPLNWINFGDESGFDAQMSKLEDAINFDKDYVHQHTYLLVRAIYWEENKRLLSGPLQGEDLTNAENWLVKNSGKKPSPLVLQEEFINECRRAEDARLAKIAEDARILEELRQQTDALTQRTEELKKQTEEQREQTDKLEKQTRSLKIQNVITEKSNIQLKKSTKNYRRATGIFGFLVIIAIASTGLLIVVANNATRDLKIQNVIGSFIFGSSYKHSGLYDPSMRQYDQAFTLLEEFKGNQTWPEFANNAIITTAHIDLALRFQQRGFDCAQLEIDKTLSHGWCAEDNFHNAILINKSNWDAYFGLAEFYIANQRCDDARNTLNDINKLFDFPQLHDPDKHRLSGMIDFCDRHFDQALKVFINWVKQDWPNIPHTLVTNPYFLDTLYYIIFIYQKNLQNTANNGFIANICGYWKQYQQFQSYSSPYEIINFEQKQQDLFRLMAIVDCSAINN